MPKTVEQQRPARTLTKGARVIDGLNAEHEFIVSNVDVKTKYVYVTYENTDADYGPVRFELLDSVMVRTEVPTDEEAHELHRQYAIKKLTRDAEEALGHTPVQRLRELILKHEVYQSDSNRNVGGRVLDWSSGATYLELQAKYDVWAAIDNTHRRLIALYGAEQVTWLSAVAVTLNARDQRDSRVASPMSRSTNGFSNMLEDLNAWAWDWFADHMRYVASKDILDEELARLEVLVEALREKEGQDQEV